MIDTARKNEIKTLIQQWFGELIETEHEICTCLSRDVSGTDERAELALVVAHVRNSVLDAIEKA